jgi:hypothetical protein
MSALTSFMCIRGPSDVHCDHLIECVDRRVFQPGAARPGAGVVDEDVDPTAQIDRPPNCALDVRFADRTSASTNVAPVALATSLPSSVLRPLKTTVAPSSANRSTMRLPN